MLHCNSWWIISAASIPSMETTAKMKIVVLISANAEWRAVRPLFPNAEIKTSPFGEWFDLTFDSVASPIRGTPHLVHYFHGGWGKISAAATAQYVIDHFQPDLLVNLGTCGGFEGRIEAGTIVLVEKTIVYDIIEQMTDPEGAIAHYSTTLDLAWLTEPYPVAVQRGLLVSGDRDIVVSDIPMLVQKYKAVAADWESGAIAWVANKNRVRCLILRGVTDLVGSGGGEAYGNFDLFQQRTNEVMERLVKQLEEWLDIVTA
jgi:adenosylhomocysteine nucleosidase